MKQVKFILVSILVLSLFAGVMAEEEVSLADLHPEITPVVIAETPSLPSPTSIATIPPDKVLRDGTVQIVITAGGDMTIGGDVRKRGDSLFDKELKKQGGDLNFITRNVRDILLADDMTIVNFESTLTTAPVFKTNNQFVFSAPPEYVQTLKGNGIEAVSLENNHVMDHGDEGLQETKATLDAAGIIWSDHETVGVYKVHNVTIAMLSYQTFNGLYPTLFEQVPQDVQNAKAQYDIVIVSYHWGDELDYKPNNNQVKLGRLTIDSGADLVVGHHSHRINPIEKYKDRYIAYSLGNFSFAGNSKPSDMSTFLLQVSFNVKDKEITTDAFRIIPARISSKSDYNDFAPTPFTEQRLIDNVTNVLKSNGRNLEFAVESYPVDWE